VPINDEELSREKFWSRDRNNDFNSVFQRALKQLKFAAPYMKDVIERNATLYERIALLTKHWLVDLEMMSIVTREDTVVLYAMIRAQIESVLIDNSVEKLRGVAG